MYLWPQKPSQYWFHMCGRANPPKNGSFKHIFLSSGPSKILHPLSEGCGNRLTIWQIRKKQIGRRWHCLGLPRSRSTFAHMRSKRSVLQMHSTSNSAYVPPRIQVWSWREEISVQVLKLICRIPQAAGFWAVRQRSQPTFLILYVSF